MTVPEIVGIVNITEDSFSDGGKFLQAGDAIGQAEKLIADGADIIDLGAASSNPHSHPVSAEVEIQRLAPVVAYLKAKNLRISVDTTKPEVQRFALSQGVEFLNDIRGFPNEARYAELASARCKLVVMHFISDLDKAVRVPKTPKEVLDSIDTFFAARIPALASAGVATERLVIDPGMGFFLASNPEPSLAVLARLRLLKERFALPLMIGVSRKSFLKNISPDADVGIRTLAAEVYSAMEGVAYLRTHDVRQLREALTVLTAIEAQKEG